MSQNRAQPMIQMDTGDGWKPVPGLASMAVGEPEPPPEGDEVRTQTAYSASYQISPEEVARLRRALVRQAVLRHIEHVSRLLDEDIRSAMRTEYRRKTRHRRSRR